MNCRLTFDMNEAGSHLSSANAGEARSELRIADDNRMTTPPDAAIVGAGLMGRWHMFSARRAGAKIFAVVDPEPGAAKALAMRASGVRTAADIETLLALGKPFAAHICAPSQHHFTLAKTLIAAGVHVFVEKPLCRSPEEARSLVAQARQNNVILCPVHQYAFQSGIEQALRWTADLGHVRRISFDIRSAGANRMPQGRRMAVVDEILPHPLSILQRLLPAALKTDSWSVAASPEGEYFANASSNGAFVTISISLNARPTCFLTRIEGDGGVIEIDGFHGFATLVRGGTSRFSKIAGPFTRSSAALGNAAFNLAKRAIQREPAYPGLASLTRQFYAAATGLAASPVSPDQIIENVDVWRLLRVDSGANEAS